MMIGMDTPNRRSLRFSMKRRTYNAFALLGIMVCIAVSMSRDVLTLDTTLNFSVTSTNNLTYTAISTHHVGNLTCPSDIQGTLVIQHTDMWSGFGTVFFQLVVAQLIYADRHSLHPIIHLGNSSLTVYDPQVHSAGTGRRVTGLSGSSIPLVPIPRLVDDYPFPGPPRRHTGSNIETKSWYHKGTGLWKHYFQDLPSLPISCTNHLPSFSMSPPHVSPGLFFYAPWSPKAWRYDKSPDAVTRPHLAFEEWIQPQRKETAKIIQKYYRLQPDILWTVQSSLPVSVTHHHCLGLHIRWSDKKIARRLLGVEEFLPYVEAYVEHFQEIFQSDLSPCIYLATDSWLVWEEIQAKWSSELQTYITQQQTTDVVRSNDSHHVADLASHHVVNRQTLVDIVALSNCSFLIHGHSAISESAIALSTPYQQDRGAILMDQSVNLEDPDRPFANATLFGSLVRKVLEQAQDTKSKRLQAPMIPRRREWWQQDLEVGRDCNLSDSVAVVLSRKDADGYPMSVGQWTIQVFVELVHQLVASSSTLDYDGDAKGKILVDPLWSYWFESLSSGGDLQGSANCAVVIQCSEHVHSDLWNKTSRKLLSSVYARQQYGTAFITPSGDSRDNSLASVRNLMNDILSKVLRLRPYLVSRADSVFPADPTRVCLGIFVDDPGYHINPATKQLVADNWAREQYSDLMNAYAHSGGTCIYLASDSHSIWNEMLDDIAENFGKMSVYTQDRIARNRGMTRAHWMESSIERLGSEVLVDVWNLSSKCGAILHGPHVVAEAALYWNSNLISVPIVAMEMFGDAGVRKNQQDTWSSRARFHEWLQIL